MRKYLVLVFLIVSIFAISACSNDSNTNSNTGTNQTQNTTQSDTTQSAPTTQDSSTNQNSSTNVAGDWKYVGTVDNKSYEIELDLEQNGEYELTVDEESAEDTEDSKSTGTYVVDGNKIRLSIITVQDTSSYFTGTVVQNGQVEFDYTLNGTTLTLNNAADSIAVLPGKIDMMRS